MIWNFQTRSLYTFWASKINKKGLDRFSFTIPFIFFFVQKGFNFVLKELLNPFIFVSTSETILEYFCPQGFVQSVHTCFDLRNYFFIFCQEGFAQSIHACFDLRNCFKIFLSRMVACFDLWKYFRIFLSRRVYSILSCLFWPQKVFQNIFVQEGLLDLFMLVLSSETFLEHFCQEGLRTNH